MSRLEGVTALASSLLVNFCCSLCFCEAKLIFKAWTWAIYLVRFSFSFLICAFLLLDFLTIQSWRVFSLLFLMKERKSPFWNLFGGWIEHSRFSANTPSPEISHFKLSVVYYCCLYAKPLITLPKIITSKWRWWQKYCHAAKDFADLESSWEGERVQSQ